MKLYPFFRIVIDPICHREFFSSCVSVIEYLFEYNQFGGLFVYLALLGSYTNPLTGWHYSFPLFCNDFNGDPRSNALQSFQLFANLFNKLISALNRQFLVFMAA